MTLFWYGSPFGLMVFIAPCFLGNLQSLVSWSLSEEATSIYTLTEFNKAPLFHQSLGPRVSVSVSVSLSLFLANSLEHGDRLRNAGNISLFPSFTFSSLTPDHQVPVHSRTPTSGTRNRAWYTWQIRTEWPQGLLRPVSTKTWVNRLESTLTFLLYFIPQGLSASQQWIEARPQTVVECNPWFPDEGSFDSEIWHQVKENVEWADRQGKNIPIDFWPLWALIKAMILPFQGNSSPPDIQQQAEHLLHEYELDDENLKKAQLEQHKIFQNFPTNPALVPPSTPPLPAGTNPKVSPLIEPNDSGNNSLKTPFNVKTDNNNNNLNNNNLPPSWQKLSKFLALQSQVSEANGFSAFPVLRNAQRQIIP